ncbi:hypothetical protein FHS18_001814 [Paenibacillus phyllosphaerae]|uniref:5-bromo-4-chloroindolyl phosphate hydrolysis protein n=1 Tax=Paenibacillus phyllosphaerae TaxID=274593 RepID=A0A7W5FM07_9BACL|nr:hypothetical protein [Paenibacillus phyllosphaerae]MBB3109751.1 hypothetical protein [Paenibacillus phyllosphaerae]
MLPKSIIGAGIGYIVALLSSSFMPEFASLLLPVLGIAVGSLLSGKRPTVPPLTPPNTTDPYAHAQSQQPRPSIDMRPAQQSQPESQSRSFASSGPSISMAPPSQPQQQLHQSQPQRQATAQASGSQASAPQAVQVNPLFEPVLQYLDVLEDMIISEGQKNNLDNEIVEKSCSLFLRLQRVIPLISELHNDEVNHTVKRLVLKDLNGVISPFLRLSGEAKSKNRRVLLNGLKDVDSKISDIVRTIEHKDLLELQTKAELIHQRYANS